MPYSPGCIRSSLSQTIYVNISVKLVHTISGVAYVENLVARLDTLFLIQSVLSKLFSSSLIGLTKIMRPKSGMSGVKKNPCF